MRAKSMKAGKLSRRTGTQQLAECLEQGSSADDLWKHDPVAAYQLWQEMAGKVVPKELIDSRGAQLESFLKGLTELAATHLHEIDADDRRLSTAQKQEVQRAQGRQAAEIPDERKKELLEYAAADEPMTDAEIRQSIVDRRMEKGLPSLSERQMDAEVQMVNRGGCSMWKCVDPTYPSNPFARLKWLEEHRAKGPRTREEHDFVDRIRRHQERRKMNRLSVEASDKKAWAAVIAQETAKRTVEAVKAKPLVVTTRLRVFDDEWLHIYFDTHYFNLVKAEQIRKALRVLYDGGYTSATGRYTTVKAVCDAAGQAAQAPNLHAIFHRMGKPKSEAVDYDKLYDLVIDCSRGHGVRLRV